MRAIVIARPGGPEVLEMRELPSPIPSREQVRVRVRAIGVNRADLLQRMGLYPAPPGVPADVPGLELAGEVDALGEGASEWRIGDRVMGLVAGGAYAEHVVLHERMLARVPEGMRFSEAAAIPEAFVTAWDAMVTQAGLSTGETALVHAAGSGVGTAAIQIARMLGARVIGTARSKAKLDRARSFGMDDGVLASEGRFAAEVLRISKGADVILELVGGPYVLEDIACAAPRARIMLAGLMGGGEVGLPLAEVLRKRITITGTVLRSRPIEEKIAAGLTLRKLVASFEKGRLRPVVDTVLPLDRAPCAHERLARNISFGKVILET